MAWNTSTRRAQLPADWERIRARILKRDGFQCTHHDDYGRRCVELANQVDHIERGNDHSDSNLRALCEWHHQRKSSAEGQAAQIERRRIHSERWRRTEDHPGKGDGVSRRKYPRPPRG